MIFRVRDREYLINKGVRASQLQRITALSRLEDSIEALQTETKATALEGKPLRRLTEKLKRQQVKYQVELIALKKENVFT